MLVRSTSTSGSNKRIPPPRGFPPRCPSLGNPFCFVQLFFGFSVRGDTSCRSSPPAGPFSTGSALPSSLAISSLLRPPIRGVYFLRGRRMCLPVSTSSLAIVFGTSPFWGTCTADTVSTVAFGRVSRARLLSFAWSLHFSPSLSTESTRQDYLYRAARRVSWPCSRTSW